MKNDTFTYSSEKLRKAILSFADIEFEYNGIQGAICSFSENDMSIGYGKQEKEYKSVDELMEDGSIIGKPLNEVAADLIFYQDFEF